MTTAETLTAWSAKRSGASMTITGLGASGEPVTITGVELIEAGDPWPIATDLRGEKFELGQPAKAAEA